MTTLAATAPQTAADPDAALVRAMARGDEQALRRLYARHGRGVLAYLVLRLGDDRVLAEEVLQDVMLAAWHAASSFRGDSKVKTWLLAIAHNRAINALRRRRVDTTAMDPARVDRRNAAASSSGRIDETTDLRSAMRHLPEHQRAVLQLVFYHGLTTSEAAEVLGVPEGTVKSRLHRAAAALRERLAEGDERDV